MAARTTPVDIAIDLKQRQVRITWQDGYLSTYTLDKLRQSCPCAVCNETRNHSDDDPLRILTPDQALAKGELELDRPLEVVGQYALQFFWADGHRTGLYTYQYLRQLDEQN